MKGGKQAFSNAQYLIVNKDAVGDVARTAGLADAAARVSCGVVLKSALVDEALHVVLEQGATRIAAVAVETARPQVFEVSAAVSAAGLLYFCGQFTKPSHAHQRVRHTRGSRQ